MSRALAPNFPRTKSAEIPWRERPHVTMQNAAQIAGVSVPSLYRFASNGKLVLKRLGGRTLVDTPSLIALTETAEVWSPSTQTQKACESRKAAEERVVR